MSEAPPVADAASEFRGSAPLVTTGESEKRLAQRWARAVAKRLRGLGFPCYHFASFSADAAGLLGIDGLPGVCKLMLVDGKTYAPLCEAWTRDTRK